MDKLIAINNTTQSPYLWEIEMNKAVDTGWFDTIDRHLRANGIWILYPLIKKKACHIRMARKGCYSLHVKHYQEDFGESMPLHVDGKDWEEVLKLEIMISQTQELCRARLLENRGKRK